jgi:hypothetical protein
LSSRDRINGTLVPRDPSPPTKVKLAPIGQSLPLLFGPQKLLKVLIEEPYIPVRIEEPTPSKQGEAAPRLAG